MIGGRATGPGPRTVAQQGGPAGTRSATRAWVGAVGSGLLASLALAVAACGSGPGPSGNVSTSSSAIAVASSPASTGASAAPGGSPAPDPSGPSWPGTTVLATIALGAADGEIQKAGIDLETAVNNQDLKAMWGAADGLAKMIDGLMPNIARLEIYPATQPAAAIYRTAFPEISAGAKQLRDAITAGDANGIIAGSQQLEQGLADYGPVRQLIAGLVEQAIVQQRLLLQ